MDLFSIYSSFKEEQDCHDYLIKLRWPDGVECVFCKSKAVYKRSHGYRMKCRSCNKSFSVTAGTVFHSTKLPLSRWFLAITQILAAKKGISSLQLMRTLKVNKNTAWYIQRRLRKAMKSDAIIAGMIELSRGKPKNQKSSKLRQHSKRRSRKGSFAMVKIEGYFSLFRRAMIGQYHQLSDRHMESYVQEIAFKKNLPLEIAFNQLLIRACAIC